MRHLLFLLCILLATVSGWAQELTLVETPGDVLRFELGEVKVPPGSQWKTKSQGELKIYVGAASAKPGSLFMVTVLKKPMRPGDNPAREVQQFAEGLAESFAARQGGLDGKVDSQADARGGTFQFRSKQGGEVFGSLILGTSDTLVITSQGTSRAELDQFVATFKPDAIKMAPPKPLKEVRQKLITGFAFLCMFVNGFLGLLGGLVAVATRGNFWRGAAATMAVFGLVEFVGALYFVSKNLDGDSFQQGEIVGYLVGSMAFSCGVPVLLASLLGRRKAPQR